MEQTDNKVSNSLKAITCNYYNFFRSAARQREGKDQRNEPPYVCCIFYTIESYFLNKILIRENEYFLRYSCSRTFTIIAKFYYNNRCTIIPNFLKPTIYTVLPFFFIYISCQLLLISKIFTNLLCKSRCFLVRYSQEVQIRSDVRWPSIGCTFVTTFVRLQNVRNITILGL